jgi:hypothetical protein
MAGLKKLYRENSDKLLSFDSENKTLAQERK